MSAAQQMQDNADREQRERALCDLLGCEPGELVQRARQQREALEKMAQRSCPNAMMQSEDCGKCWTCISRVALGEPKSSVGE